MPATSIARLGNAPAFGLPPRVPALGSAPPPTTAMVALPLTTVELPLGPNANVDGFRHLLQHHGIDVTDWGSEGNKGIGDLWREVQRGEVELKMDSMGHLVRCLSVVKVCVRRPEAENEHLIEALQIFPSGRRKRRDNLLSETLLRDETPLEGASRGLFEELGMAANVDIEENSLRTWREAIESPSYPTLRSVYDLHQFSACVSGLPNKSFITKEHGAEDDRETMIHVWAWRKDVEVLVSHLRRAVAENSLERRNQVTAHPGWRK